MKNYTIIIFGGTGDLAKRKLIPAINSIAKNNADFKINVLGIGRRTYTEEEYKNFLLQEKEIAKNMTINYFIADIEKEGSLNNLKNKLASIEDTTIDGRLYYLSTSYKLFETIAKSIHSCCINGKGFTRIIAEKPFGYDLKSSKKLNASLKKYFTEEQIYRADHYLAKETIENILRLRFSNPLFESVWNSKSINRIKIVVDEELGVGNRLGYYDDSGAIKDMVQNHLLQTLSLILMEPPKSLDENDFKKSKIEAIQKLFFKEEIITGQYAGYQEEVKNINPESKTETFVELKLHSKTKRWKGTEMILRTGKMLKEKKAYIEIEFKKEPCTLYCDIGSAPNKLFLHIQPLQNVELTMNTALLGEKMNLTPVKMTFCPTCEFKANSPEGYEVILKECLLGNKKIFMCDKEIDVAWRLTDKIISTIKNKDIKPIIYAPTSTGPSL
ncbi:glucose-6-phosphate dehydrogenase [Candidatus Woesearchaeota archaeon]|nr:glucose-6-phosphate dehydrogenase [Candidatus Woesearchaeota archaeon]